MSQDDYWSELPSMQEEDADFNWEDFLNEPTFEPEKGFEGDSIPLRQNLNPAVESRTKFGETVQTQLNLSLDKQSLATTFNQAEYSPSQATLHSAATSKPPQPEANDQPFNGTASPLPADTRHVCGFDGCEKRYAREGDRERHKQNVHCNPSRYLCHYRRCPRGIKGHGFPRKDKLIDHLKSRKHELEHEDAVYEAAKHNPPRLDDPQSWARVRTERFRPWKLSAPGSLRDCKYSPTKVVGVAIKKERLEVKQMKNEAVAPGHMEEFPWFASCAAVPY